MSPRVKWHRAGRGSCEIRSVEIGTYLRVSAVLDTTAPGQRGKWRAFLNLGGLGVYDSFEEAQARCDEELRREARTFAQDWETYLKLYPVAFKTLGRTLP